MATLVLTTVGGLIGGPIGAAAGAVIGQTIDGSLFASRGREGPRLADLAVQTSRYGAPLPPVFGTMRVAGQVIWATDLVEYRERQGGGKGQPSATRYSYSASFAVALSARPLLGVGRIWADGNLLRGAAGDWKVATGFRLHLGGEDQAVDPLIASAEGIAQTPAHRGLAYAVFENLPLDTFGNRIPSLTFEVSADPAPVSVGAIAREIGSGVVIGAGPALPLDGFAAHGTAVRDVLEMLADVSGGWFATVPGGVAMRDGSGAEHAIAAEDRTRRIVPLARVPRTLSIAHHDPARNWQVGVQHATRAGPGGAARVVEAPVAVWAGAAKAIATAALARAEAERVTRRVTLDAQGAQIVPGDRVMLDGAPWRVTASLFERHAVTLDLVALAPPIVPAGASSGRVSAAPDLVAGTTVLHAFEPPSWDGAATQPHIAVVAAGTGDGWRRAVLQTSRDGGGSWHPAGGTAAPGVVGEVVTGTGAGPRTLTDRTATIEVLLAHPGMMLADADPSALDSGANLARLGGELVQFAQAEPLGGGLWRLRDLWRGRRGSDAGPIVEGAPFTLLDPDTVLLLPLMGVPGDPVQLLASGTGDAEAVTASVTLSGASVLPPAPVRLTARRGDAGVTLRWRRRSRGDWRWRDGVDVALGEEGESYVVTLAVMEGSRSQEVGSPMLFLPAADLPAGPMTVAVRQRGTHGLSPAATITI